MRSYIAERADLIVIVEGYDLKFLQHFPEIQSQDDLEVLADYITSLPRPDHKRMSTLEGERVPKTRPTSEKDRKSQRLG